MDSTFFIFELKFHKAYNLPTVNCCPLCYVASTWLVPPPRGPALHRVGPAIKPCAGPLPASPRSTTVTTATQEPVSPLGPPPKVVGAGNGLDKHGLVELPAARCRKATAAQCQGLVNLEFLHAIPPGPESLSPAFLQLCHIQLDKRGGDNTAGF